MLYSMPFDRELFINNCNVISCNEDLKVFYCLVNDNNVDSTVLNNAKAAAQRHCRLRTRKFKNYII